ncbi:MAG: hypothetical protein P1U74_08690 [Legionellaceae bacterium]|nr:hypothetical protein [Legionellaceae bacterium]
MFIKDFQKQKHVVLMVGDSFNDAAAVTCADVGMAMRSPSADIETQNLAGFVLNNDNLSPLVPTLEIAALARKVILINLSISLSYNIAITIVAAGLFVSLGFTLNPIIGVALMIAESVIVMGILLAFKFSKVQSSTSKNLTESGHGIFAASANTNQCDVSKVYNGENFGGNLSVGSFR